jgi:hypothetical protein
VGGQRQAPAALPPGRDLVPVLQDTRTPKKLKLIEHLKLRMPVELMAFQKHASETFQEDL